MNRKSRSGPHFEDFHVGMHIVHPTPRTLTEGDRSLYIGLTGSRDPLVSATTTSALAGVPGAPLDPLLVFNVAFGKTVPDISLNAVANLGYADLRFLQFVFPGDTLRVESGIIGLREASNRKAGIVYTRSVAINQRSEPVLSWIRWVLVKKRVVEAPAPATDIPALPQKVLVEDLVVPPYASAVSRLHTVTGSTDYWEDYVPDERIDHPSAMTINDSDHSIATRLYQNTAKVHFDARLMRDTAAGRRLVYGGHIISICRSLSYDGLENVLGVLAINGGTHVAPTYAGDTISCATRVLERIDLGVPHLGALRLRTVGAKDVADVSSIVIPDEPLATSKYAPETVLDLDYVVLMPKTALPSSRSTH